MASRTKIKEQKKVYNKELKSVKLKKKEKINKTKILLMLNPNITIILDSFVYQ